MTTILKRVSIGNVGDLPGRVLMQTSASMSDVQVAGFMNSVESFSGVLIAPTDLIMATMANNDMAIFKPVFNAGVITLVDLSAGGSITGGQSLGGDPIYAGVSGSNLTFKGLTAGSNISLSQGANAITINATGGGGGFAYEQALWVSQANGSDGNAGTSIDTPLATVQAAINKIVSGAPVIIYVVDANGSNNETIASPGLGYTINIVAPGTSFQGSVTQASGDLIILEAFYVDAFVSNSSSPTYLYGGEMNVTTTSTGIVYATLSQYTGFHTGSGTIVVNADILSGLTTDSSIAAYVNAPFSQGITNAGTLYITTGTSPSSALTSNTGTITGMMGDVSFGRLGVAPGSGAAAAYNFPTVDGTANYFLQTDGAGTVSWAPGGGGGGFAYVNAYWVSQANGNDSNLGTSINEPLLTVQAAINLASTTPSVIYVVDSTLANSEALTISSGQTLFIDAPGTQFVGSIINGGSTTFHASYLQSWTENAISYIYTDLSISNVTCNSQMYIFGGELSATEVTNGGILTATVDICSNLTVDVGGQAIIVTASLIGSLTVAGIANINAASANPVITNIGNIYGNLGGVNYGDLGMAPTTDNTAAYSITGAPPTGANQVLVSSGAGPGATTSWAAQTSYTPYAYTNEYWVDPTNGSDSNLGTSIETPFQTVQHAINTASGTTAVVVNYLSPTNSETISYSGLLNITINAPGTIFTGAISISGGPKFTMTAGNITNTLTLDIIQGHISFTGNTTGSATGTLTLTSANTVYCENLGPGFVAINIAASCSLYYTGIVATLNNAAGGDFYGTGCFIGTLNNVFGSVFAHSITSINNSNDLKIMCLNGTVTTNTGSITGIIGNTVFGALALAASNSTGAVYTLPTTDGTPGQVLTTNGAGVVSWV